MIIAVEVPFEPIGGSANANGREVDTLQVNIGSDFEIVAESIAAAVDVVGKSLQICGSLDNERVVRRAEEQTFNDFFALSLNRNIIRNGELISSVGILS